MTTTCQENFTSRTRGAELLEEWILSSGLHNRLVAPKLGVTHATIHRWRTGELLPHESRWKKIAQVTRGAVPAGAWREPPLGPPVTREQRRSRRVREVRARTVSVKRMTKRDLEIGRLAYPEDTRPLRPKTRAECVGGHRPCPFVSCKYHLYLDIDRESGAIKLNFPDLEPEQLRVSCALDVADGGGATLEEVGAIMNLTRERVRQLELRATEQIALDPRARILRELIDDPILSNPHRRRLPVVQPVEPYAEETESEDALDHADIVDLDELEGWELWTGNFRATPTAVNTGCSTAPFMCGSDSQRVGSGAGMCITVRRSRAP